MLCSCQLGGGSAGAAWRSCCGDPPCPCRLWLRVRSVAGCCRAGLCRGEGERAGAHGGGRRSSRTAASGSRQADKAEQLFVDARAAALKLQGRQRLPWAADERGSGPSARAASPAWNPQHQQHATPKRPDCRAAAANQSRLSGGGIRGAPLHQPERTAAGGPQASTCRLCCARCAHHAQRNARRPGGCGDGHAGRGTCPESRDGSNGT